jgi:hypothetical protein
VSILSVLFQILSYRGELLQGGFQIGAEDFRGEQVCGFPQRVAFQLENIQVHLVAFLERMLVMDFQMVAINFISDPQLKPLGIASGWLNGGASLFIRRFKEQQKRQLLHVIAVGQAVFAEDVAVIPELLDELRWVGHIWHDD